MLLRTTFPFAFLSFESGMILASALEVLLDFVSEVCIKIVFVLVHPDLGF